VASGTYPEAVTVAGSGTSTAPIVFTAAPGATVTVTGQANGFVVSARSWVTIAGFNVTTTTGVGIKVSDSSRITLSGNHVSYAGQPVSGKTYEGILLANVTDSLVSRNTADHNTEAGISLKAGSSRNEVSGNVVFSNARGRS
jgi:parallel beta-helix repeat protein